MSKRSFLQNQHQDIKNKIINSQDLNFIIARRTAFVARFIVLRESRRSKGHREIELLTWDESATAEELAVRFKDILTKHHANASSVDRDIKRALEHSSRTIAYFVDEYVARSTTNFQDALKDYQESNALLFGEEEQPKITGWNLTVDP